MTKSWKFVELYQIKYMFSTRKEEFYAHQIQDHVFTTAVIDNLDDISHLLQLKARFMAQFFPYSNILLFQYLLHHSD